MTILTNNIPILEYDDSENAVINSRDSNPSLKLPKKCVFAFLGDLLEKFALENGAEIISKYESSTKSYPVFIVKHKNHNVALCQAPVGAPAATMILDWLISHGVRHIISAGSCGCLEKFGEGEFLVPSKALRDEGTSYHYKAPSRFICTDSRARKAIEKAIAESSFKYREVTTWTTDAFYRETKEKVLLRKKDSCSVVDMECSALAACAEFKKAIFGMIFYTADTLHDIENYDRRNLGRGVENIIFRLCLDSVVEIYDV